MKQQLENRLKNLRAEFESGQKALADLEVKQMNLRNTLLRISGAIQVLEEELAKEEHPAQDGIGRLEGVPKSEPITE
jgi:predicted  nucleic acid-binding Zn-ribbon protein